MRHTKAYRYKEISLNGLGKVTAKDIVNVLMNTVEVLYDSDYVELFGHSPEVCIIFDYGVYGCYETLKIDLILDRNIHPFYINTENIQGIDFVKNVRELFFTELNKLDELYNELYKK